MVSARGFVSTIVEGRGNVILLIMKVRTATTSIRWRLPTEVVKDFAGVRGRVRNAVEASPQSVTLSNALAQVRRFQLGPLKK